MTTTPGDPQQPFWRKSTRSNGQAMCVEVATNVPATVLVRDSKDPAGPALTFSPADWTSFLSTLTPDTH